MSLAPLLEVEDLSVAVHGPAGIVKILDRIGFSIRRGQAVGIVGESGSGKSMTALSIMRLHRDLPPGGLSGSIRFDGMELLPLPEDEMRRLRGDRIAMIFQEPMSSLNPVMRIGKQVAETLRVHRQVGAAEAERAAIELLRKVRIADPEARAREYPHQLSGGMRQRVMIASALACRPSLLIADEPTTALDVTIQAQVLELLAELRRELDMAVLLISHDLGVIARFCDFVVVMYAGQVVESAPVDELFAAPRHPYTRALLDSMPKLGGDKSSGPLREIPGRVPALDRLPAGCRFADRCSQVAADCRQAPVAASVEGARTTRCLHPLGPPERAS